MCVPHGALYPAVSFPNMTHMPPPTPHSVQPEALQLEACSYTYIEPTVCMQTFFFFYFFRFCRMPFIIK